MHPSQYHVIVEPAFSSRAVTLTSSDTQQVARELKHGHQASIFGEYPFPYRFRIPAMEATLYGDAEDFEDLAEAAEMINGADLSAREKLAVWAEVVAESRNIAHREPAYSEIADDEISELLDEDE